MTDRPVALIAFQEQDNLGIGYIASAVMDAGYEIELIDFRSGKEKVLDLLMACNPLVVGFSVIFQHHIHHFRELILFLRNNGISCHFSAGGHYPSLRPDVLLDIIPELDSLVLFEGERTFTELVKLLSTGNDWKNLPGIAYLENGSLYQSPLRPLVSDLDEFSPPVRPQLREYAFGKKYATILAGRGCIHNCSFCSIHQFYSKPPGPVKRVRRPEMVAREMELLHEEMDCTIFLFQDDDFPVGRSNGEWLRKFCGILAEKGLHDKVLWKISCRPDEVTEEQFTLMKEHGLFLVYLGIESGTDEGLRLMNKNITADANQRAIEVLKRLDIVYDYGFMLFDPSSTFESILSNLEFLRSICIDGTSPVTFCKMLPYAETQIEKILRSEGRLKGDIGFENYDFNDNRLNSLYSFMAYSFSDWIGEHDGVLNLARWTRYYLAVYRNFHIPNKNFSRLEKSVHQLISQSNLFLLDTALAATSIFQSENVAPSPETLARMKINVEESHKFFQSELDKLLIEINSSVTE